MQHFYVDAQPQGLLADALLQYLLPSCNTCYPLAILVTLWDFYNVY